MNTIEITLRSAVAALRRIHVLGSEAELLAGTIKALESVIKAIEEAKKMGADHDANEGGDCS